MQISCVLLTAAFSVSGLLWLNTDKWRAPFYQLSCELCHRALEGLIYGADIQSARFIITWTWNNKQFWLALSLFFFSFLSFLMQDPCPVLRKPASLSANMGITQQMLHPAKPNCQPGPPLERNPPNTNFCLPPTCSTQNLLKSPPSLQTKRNEPSLLLKTAQGWGNTSCSMEGPCLWNLQARGLLPPPLTWTRQTESRQTGGWRRLLTACQLISSTQQLPTIRSHPYWELILF